MNRLRAARAVNRWIALGSLLAGAGCLQANREESPAAVPSQAAAAPTPAPVASDLEARIRFYEAKLDADPELFAVWANLGLAYLERARQTHAVDVLLQARGAFERSQSLLDNLEARAGMAALYAFSHRFERALEFADQVAAANPRDGRLLGLRMEANLGLGRLQEAARLLDGPDGSNAPGFQRAALRGRWFAEQQRYDEARTAFEQAAQEADRARVPDLVIWAKTSAAGTFIDAKHAEPALPYLQEATRLPGTSSLIQSVLRVHWAELYTLQRRQAQALAEYTGIAEHQEDPELLRRAFLLARELGAKAQARALFERAERASRRVLDAGEIFALEAYARLLADQGDELERAEQLALRNLAEGKRDLSARQTLEYVRTRKQALAGAARRAAFAPTARESGQP